MSFAIQSDDGHHLGFLLCAGGPAQGDCVFRSLPKAFADFDLPESDYLFELQEQGEFHWFDTGGGSLRIENASAKIIAEIVGEQMTSSNYSFLVVRLEPSK